jgi:hypothetical protein
MEIAPSAPTDQQIDIKQERSSTSSQGQPKDSVEVKYDIPFGPAKKHKRSEIHDKYGGKEWKTPNT